MRVPFYSWVNLSGYKISISDIFLSKKSLSFWANSRVVVSPLSILLRCPCVVPTDAETSFSDRPFSILICRRGEEWVLIYNCLSSWRDFNNVLIAHTCQLTFVLMKNNLIWMWSSIGSNTGGMNSAIIRYWNKFNKSGLKLLPFHSIHVLSITPYHKCNYYSGGYKGGKDIRRKRSYERCK